MTPIQMEATALMEVDKNQLSIAIAKLILTDTAYQAGDWDSIALVYDLSDGQEGGYGYVFSANGDWVARTPSENKWDALDKMIELQAVMERETGKKWLKALVHITRADQGLNIQFEYDDPNKWAIKPADLETSVMALKP